MIAGDTLKFEQIEQNVAIALAPLYARSDKMPASATPRPPLKPSDSPNSYVDRSLCRLSIRTRKQANL